MPRPDFGGFQTDLLKAGVSPRHVFRANNELEDHFDDLVEEALLDSVDISTAEQRACNALGDLQSIAAEIRCRPELRGWAFRYPHVAVVVYPLLCLALLPAAPIVAGIAYVPKVARWAACMLLSGVITAGMLLLLQMTISLT